MNCTECKEKLVEYIEGILPESQRQMIKEHLKDCQQCHAELTELKELGERLICDSAARRQSSVEDVVFNRIIREQNEKLKQADRIKRQFRIWRQIMNNKITKYTAAAAMLLVGVLLINFLDISATSAYAMEQTIEASHSVRYLHIKSFNVNEDEPKEFWVDFYKDGEVKNVRMHMPEWDSPEDGAKVTVWKENKAQIWFKKKNSLITLKNKTVAARTLKFIKELDPKLVVERLSYAQQAGGAVEIDVDDPSDKAEPIVITATCLPGSSRAGWRLVLFVDRATKLVTSIEFYKLKDDEYQYVELIEYYDYNQPIEAEMFSLDNDDIPADVTRIDRTTQEIGLIQGNLTDKEIAVKVVREFYEALIVKDYAKAGQVNHGVPAAKMQERWQDINVLRVVSISEPVPHPHPGVGGFQVKCEIEIEKDGVRAIMKPYGPGVRPVRGQPHRWNIHGGSK